MTARALLFALFAAAILTSLGRGAATPAGKLKLLEGFDAEPPLFRTT